MTESVRKKFSQTKLDYTYIFLKESLNVAFARAVYVTGSPLSITENPAWIKFFQLLRPAYQLPSRKSLSTKYLKNEYLVTKEKCISDIKIASNLNLQCDGWSNCRNEAIVNFIITTPHPIFIEFVDTKENRHTSEYLMQIMDNVIMEYDPKKFFVVIGDNAKNIQHAFELLKEKYSHLILLGCIAHTLHLLCGDIF